MELFTDNWMNPPVLYEGERLYHIVNYSTCDDLYVVRPANMHGTEFDDEVRWSLMRKYGWLGRDMSYELEDVTDIWCDEL